jgi:hypothetical protein
MLSPPVVNNSIMTIKTSTFQTADPQIFGPPLWFSLHNMANAFPEFPNELEKKMAKTLLTNLTVLIPCEECQEHTVAYLKDKNLNDLVKNRDTLFNFFWKFHNFVNQRTGKAEISLEKANYLFGSNNTFEISVNEKVSSKNLEISVQCFWFVLFNAAVVFPDKPTILVKKMFQEIFFCLLLFIPDVRYRTIINFFLENTVDFDLVVESRDALFQFIVRMFNFVQRNLFLEERSEWFFKKNFGFNHDIGDEILCIQFFEKN